MKLSDWARRHGISYKTAWRWWKAGILPVPARRLPTGTILVEEAAAPEAEGEVVVYVRDVLEVLTSAAARLYGRRSARRRARRALEAMR